MTANDELLARADYWLAHFEMRVPGDDIDADLIHDLAAALRTTETQRDALREVGDAMAEELVQHGWGDFHYGDQPQDRSVVEAITRWRAEAEAIAHATRSED